MNSIPDRGVLDAGNIEIIMFDCYGTLIDWETGILRALRPLMQRYGVKLSDEAVLEQYAEIESHLEAGPFLRYSEVLVGVVEAMARRWQVDLRPEDREVLVKSLPSWPPFPEVPSCLKRLKKHVRLAILSNIDRDLFEQSSRHQGVSFDFVFVAEEIGSYKPDLRNFRYALERLPCPPQRVLHVAQSLYHDIVPAKILGLTTVWVNRRKGRPGFGATPPAEATPDWEVADLHELLSLLGLPEDQP